MDRFQSLLINSDESKSRFRLGVTIYISLDSFFMVLKELLSTRSSYLPPPTVASQPVLVASAIQHSANLKWGRQENGVRLETWGFHRKDQGYSATRGPWCSVTEQDLLAMGKPVR